MYPVPTSGHLERIEKFYVQIFGDEICFKNLVGINVASVVELELIN